MFLAERGWLGPISDPKWNRNRIKSGPVVRVGLLGDASDLQGAEEVAHGQHPGKRASEQASKLCVHASVRGVCVVGPLFKIVSHVSFERSVGVP